MNTDNTEQNDLVVVKGEIIQMSSRFWNEGWGFGRIQPAGKGDPIRITGTLEGFKPGQVVTVTGKYHSGKYGTELKIETIVVEDPMDNRGIRQWLIERVPQIGPRRAQQIALTYGVEIWNILDTAPYTLTEISGITPGRVDEIIRAWNTHKAERQVYVPFYDLGLSHKEAKKASGADLTIEAILEDPFLLYLHTPMSYARCDVVSSRANASKTARSRLIATCVQVVRDAAFEGHTAVTKDYVVEHASAYGAVSYPKAQYGLDLALEDAFLDVSDFEDTIMLPKLRTAETGIARKIKQLLESTHERNLVGPNARRSREDDADEARRDHYRRPWDGEDDGAAHLPRPSFGDEEGRPLCSDGEGGEEDGGGDPV